MGTAPLQDSYDEIILDGMPLKLRGTLPDSNLATFQRKMVIGDYTQESNPLLSSWVISDLSGGNGIFDMNESSDSTRYNIGNMYTRWPAQITSGYQVTILNGSNLPLRFRYMTDVFYLDQWYMLVSTTDPENGHTWFELNSTRLEPGISLDDEIWVEPAGHSISYRGTADVTSVITPLGEHGYLHINTETLAVTVISPDPLDAPALLDATIWDDKMVGVDIDGQLWWTTDPTNGWTNYGPTARVPTAETPRRVAAYFDRSGNPCVFVLTELRLWQFAADGPQIFNVDVSFPPGPHQGLAGTKWSGELYFSVGMGVHRYTGGALSAMGLDRDSGLPVAYNGWIVDLVPGYNSMFALVQRPDLSGYTFPDGPPTPITHLQEWTGAGWHENWEVTGADAVPYSMGITRATDGQALVWGAASNSFETCGLWFMPLPITFANPRQRLTLTNGFTQTKGFLETAVFDAGMPGYLKVASSFDVKMTVLKRSGGGQFLIRYKIDDATDWSLLGEITTNGNSSIPFGEFADGIYPGLVFERIQFRLEATTSCQFLMESAVLSFLKTVPPSNSWTPTIDLSAEYAGNSPAVMSAHIDQIMQDRLFVPLVLRGNTYRVLVSSSSGSTQTGADESALRQVSLLEVPLSLAEVN